MRLVFRWLIMLVGRLRIVRFGLAGLAVGAAGEFVIRFPLFLLFSLSFSERRGTFAFCDNVAPYLRGFALAVTYMEY